VYVYVKKVGMNTQLSIKLEERKKRAHDELDFLFFPPILSAVFPFLRSLPGGKKQCLLGAQDDALTLVGEAKPKTVFWEEGF